MTKENRAEIRTLVKAQKKILRDVGAVKKTAARQIKQCQRSILLAEKRGTKEFSRAARRIAILEGRLA
ncbi:MAG TPA: hypothetical protein VNN22_07960 [Verrucomicrobiae bacterium]|nr:hypothetical protein [Verrucomicrobiae bacterium]